MTETQMPRIDLPALTRILNDPNQLQQPRVRSCEFSIADYFVNCRKSPGDAATTNNDERRREG